LRLYNDVNNYEHFLINLPPTITRLGRLDIVEITSVDYPGTVKITANGLSIYEMEPVANNAMYIDDRTLPKDICNLINQYADDYLIFSGFFSGHLTPYADIRIITEYPVELTVKYDQLSERRSTYFPIRFNGKPNILQYYHYYNSRDQNEHYH
jgi:hypothetical protein